MNKRRSIWSPRTQSGNAAMVTSSRATFGVEERLMFPEVTPSQVLPFYFSPDLPHTRSEVSDKSHLPEDGPLDLSQKLNSHPKIFTPPLSPQQEISEVERLRPQPSTPQRLRGNLRSLLPCDVCGKAFDRPSLLKRHMRTHTGERPHACDVCEKRFSTSSSLNTHRRIHSGEKPHACGVCGKRFTASSNLYYHRMTHTKEKPHKCSLCLKSFPTPGDLRSHQYVHSGAWPFRCNACGRGFSKQTNLRNHLFLHTGDKPHCCTMCGKKFALACNLRAHAKTHEEGNEITDIEEVEKTEHFLLQNNPEKQFGGVIPSPSTLKKSLPFLASKEKSAQHLWDPSWYNAVPGLTFDPSKPQVHSPSELTKMASFWSGCPTTTVPFPMLPAGLGVPSSASTPEDFHRGLMLEAHLILSLLQQQKQHSSGTAIL